MPVILENSEIAKGVYKLRLEGAPIGRAGQFLMLSLPNVNAPFLGRPLSICDVKDSVTTLCYRVVGQGTALFAALQTGCELDTFGPYGNGFPLEEGDSVLIGGGMGIAPLVLLCRSLRNKNPKGRITVYAGFSDETFLSDELNEYADELVVDIGGYITDRVDFVPGQTYYACGPKPMLAAAARKAAIASAMLYVSLEARMACGVGACLGCSVDSASGRKRICKDGPVFLSTEVF